MSNVFFGETGPIRDPASTMTANPVANSDAQQTARSTAFTAPAKKTSGFTDAVDVAPEASRPRTLTSTSA